MSEARCGMPDLVSSIRIKSQKRELASWNNTLRANVSTTMWHSKTGFSVFKVPIPSVDESLSSFWILS